MEWEHLAVSILIGLLALGNYMQTIWNRDALEIMKAHSRKLDLLRAALKAHIEEA